jgi:hypothetical protein
MASKTMSSHPPKQKSASRRLDQSESMALPNVVAAIARNGIIA